MTENAPPTTYAKLEELIAEFLCEKIQLSERDLRPIRKEIMGVVSREIIYLAKKRLFDRVQECPIVIRKTNSMDREVSLT